TGLLPTLRQQTSLPAERPPPHYNIGHENLGRAPALRAGSRSTPADLTVSLRRTPPAGVSAHTGNDRSRLRAAVAALRAPIGACRPFAPSPACHSPFGRSRPTSCPAVRLLRARVRFAAILTRSVLGPSALRSACGFRCRPCPRLPCGQIGLTATDRRMTSRPPGPDAVLRGGGRCAAFGGQVYEGRFAPYSSAFGRRPLPPSEIQAGPEKRRKARVKQRTKVMTPTDTPPGSPHNSITRDSSN